MNTLTLSRRLALFLMLGLTSLSACKKGADVTPVPTDLGTQAAGTYTVSDLMVNGKTVSATQADLKGTITINRQSATSIDMAFDVRKKSTGEEVIVGTSNGMELSGTSSAISIIGDSSEVATIKGNKLSLAIVDDTGTRFTLGATK